ncbi:MAG: hypothetical protein QM610_03595, partial [Chitinophagaceae bacterium]
MFILFNRERYRPSQYTNVPVRKQQKGALAREVFPARFENSHKAATAAGNVPKRQHDWRAAFAFCGLDF